MVLVRFTGGGCGVLLLPPTGTAKYQLCAQGRENSVSRVSCTPQPHPAKQQLWLKKGKPAGAIPMAWKNLISLTVILEFGPEEFVVVQHWNAGELYWCFHLQKTWRFQHKIKFFSEWQQYIDLQKRVAVNNSFVKSIWFIIKHYWSFVIHPSFLSQFVVIVAHHKGMEWLDKRKWM